MNKFVKLLKRTSNPYEYLQYFKPLQFNGGVSLSIQASQNHYCNPKSNFENPSKYRSFEIMITGLDNIPEFMEEFDAHGVYGYVPFLVVQKLVEHCVELYGFAYEYDEEIYFEKIK